MRKSRFTESQIVAILKAAKAGVPVADLLRHFRTQPRRGDRRCGCPSRGSTTGDARTCRAPPIIGPADGNHSCGNGSDPGARRPPVVPIG